MDAGFGATAETQLRDGGGTPYGRQPVGGYDPVSGQAVGGYDANAGWSDYQPPEKPGGSPLRIVTIVLGGLLACLLGAVGYLALRGRASIPAADGPTGAPTTGATSPVSATTSAEATATDASTQEPTPTESATSESRSPGQIALAELKSLRRDSLAGAYLDGRWVIQLSSKYSGVRDNKLVAANGSHTFYYPDIIAEYKDLEQRMAGYGYPTFLLLGSDFGAQQNATNRKIWVTLADPGGLSDFESGQSFCARLYPELSGRDRENVCMPRRFTPPGG